MPCPGTLSKSIHLKLNNTKGQCILHLPIDNKQEILMFKTFKKLFENLLKIFKIFLKF